ncbi:MAG: sigma-54-dependent Fis family transcriptional regulator [Deltaproteobacteria bacterium]|nr:sigma-54-dependent Fis family transcriptional regulator [Deltaproteobacteria bacterium]
MNGERCYNLLNPMVLGERCRNCSAKEPKQVGLQYKTFFRIGKELLAESDIGRVLCEALDCAIEISGAERGTIMLFDKGGNILCEKTRTLKKEDIGHPEFEIDHTIIDKVRADGARICLRNNLERSMLRKRNRANRPKNPSVICFPLNHQGNISGVIYLEKQASSRAFNSEMCAFLGNFADFISVVTAHVLEHRRRDNFLGNFVDFISAATHYVFGHKQPDERVHTLEVELRGRYQFESIVSHHPKMLEILKLVAQIADTDASVLIEGGSGTGKELIAQAIHYNSNRRDKPFVPINCSALPENLLESELFGHDRGAFTDAIQDKQGWFEHAHGGTIFLDEVSEMSMMLQAKLLRVLQTGEYSRVGSTMIQHCDVRVVAATNKNLMELMKEGKFREDVYYRLNVIEIVLPPLQERKSDILLLAQHFLNIYSKQYGKENLSLSRNAEACLLAYNFPGNVRELEHIIQRAVVLADGEVIEPCLFPASVCQKSTASSGNGNGEHATFRAAKHRAVENFEREFIIECLKAAKGNISLGAKTAGINVKNFHVKMKNYRIDPRSFK